jgi:FeS assembly SUF system regulator
MLRISKLADYAVVLATHLAGTDLTSTHSVRALSRASAIPEPTVSKVVKLLTQAGVLRSQRGARGGYQLSRPAREISLAEVIAAVDGPLGLTECHSAQGVCRLEGRCGVQDHWGHISSAVERALAGVHLMQLARPCDGPLVQLRAS